MNTATARKLTTGSTGEGTPGGITPAGRNVKRTKTPAPTRPPVTAAQNPKNDAANAPVAQVATNSRKAASGYAKPIPRLETEP